MAYDSPKGETKFRGWLDDVSLKPVKPERPKAHLSDYAVTTRGTNSSGSFSRGNNFPRRPCRTASTSGPRSPTPVR